MLRGARYVIISTFVYEIFIIKMIPKIKQLCLEATAIWFSVVCG